MGAIFVQPGNYHENLLITTEALTLLGAGAATTIITGDGTSNVVYAFGIASFRIERFSVLNAGKSGSLPGSAAIYRTTFRHSGARTKSRTRNPEIVARDSGFALRAPRMTWRGQIRNDVEKPNDVTHKKSEERR